MEEDADDQAQQGQEGREADGQNHLFFSTVLDGALRVKDAEAQQILYT